MEKENLKPVATPALSQNQIEWDAVNHKPGFYISHTLFGASPATAANYNRFGPIIKRPIEILSVSVIYTAGSVSGTVQVEILEDGEANGAGANVLVTAISTVAATNPVNTKITRERTLLTSNRILKEGDQLSLVDGGTLTGLTDLTVSLYCKQANRGNYD